MVKNILYAVSSLGLGHASRSLPVIKYYIKDNNLFIVSTGGALNLLKNELKDYKNVKFYDLKDYPPLQRGKGLRFYIYLIKDSLETVFIINKEKEFCTKLIDEHKIDFIMSDVRYGFYSKKVPSFAIIHQIGFILPKVYRIFLPLVDYFQILSLKKFDVIFIPDFFGKDSLAGILSHNRLIPQLKHNYVGIISCYNNQTKTRKDIDYYFIISGFLKDTRDKFISELINQAKNLKGKKVFVLGDTKNSFHKYDKENNIEIYSYVSGKLKEDLMNRAKIVISRSGYTTIMDLIELDKKGLLAPTLHQTEQEYLAEYLNKKGSFVCFNADKPFDLKKLLMNLEEMGNLKSKTKTRDTIIKIDQIVRKHLTN